MCDAARAAVRPRAWPRARPLPTPRPPRTPVAEAVPPHGPPAVGPRRGRLGPGPRRAGRPGRRAPAAGGSTSSCAAPCRARLAGPPWRCEDGAGRLDRLGRAPLAGLDADRVHRPGARARRRLEGPRAGSTHRAPRRRARRRGARRRGARALARRRRRPAVGRAGAVVGRSASPSRRRPRRRVLAAAVARGCRDVGLSAVAAPVLAQRRGARDQVGLGARDRRSNVRGRVRRRRRRGRRADWAGRAARRRRPDDRRHARRLRRRPARGGCAGRRRAHPGGDAGTRAEGRVEDHAARGYGEANAG